MKTLVISWDETIRRSATVTVPDDYPEDPGALMAHPTYGDDGGDPWLETAEAADDVSGSLENRRVYFIHRK